MTNKLYSCDGTHGMSYWATSPLIRPRNYQCHHHNEGHCAREDYCSMDDPKYEQPEYAAIRWLSEDLRARRESFRQFRWQLLKVTLKQRSKPTGAAAAHRASWCV